MSDVGSTKRELRRKVMAARTGIPQAEAAMRSRDIVSQVLRSDLYASARSVMAYVPIRGEVDTTGFLVDVLETGRLLYLPRVSSDGSRLEVVNVEDLEHDLAKGRFGIMEPTPVLSEAADSELSSLGLIVVPGVAFDRDGYRIGYGAGYYDRLLERLSSSATRPVSLGICFAEQLVESIPRDPWDRPVDRLIVG